MIRFFLFWAFLMSQLTLFSQNSRANLSNLCNAFIKKEYNTPATISITVMDAESRAIIYSYHPHTTCIPASTQKILTSIATLETLGTDKKFKTDIGYRGSIIDGTLKGDIIIKGFGDPTSGSGLAGSSSLENLISEIIVAIKSVGIHSIEGNIIGDGSYYDSQLSNGSWMWSDIGNYFAIGASGLNIYQNKYVLSLQQNPTLYKSPKILSTYPKVPNIVFQNEVTSASRGTGDNAYIYGSSYTDKKIVRGTIPVGTGTFKIKGAVPDPPLFFSSLIYDKLKANGIILKGKPTTESNTQYSTIKTLNSPSLSDITKVVNHKSNNFLAESLFKAFTIEKCGNSSYEKGAKTLESFYSDKGIDMRSTKLKDGCGLSPMNRISSLTFCNILANTYGNKTTYNALINTMPRVGMEGTVKNMLTTSIHKGNIYAKSGTIENVRTYVGYAKTKSGKTMCFALLANNFTTRSSTIRNEWAKIMEQIASLE